MRKSQRTERKFDQLSLWDFYKPEESGVRSTDSGENTVKSSISFKELVLSRDNLNEAYNDVVENQGAAGVDGISVADLREYLRENSRDLVRSLKDLTYKPTPVKSIEIPNPDGTQRKLGIPTVVDRLVQQAVARVMTPVFEKVFSDNSFGFRPGRGASQAMNQVIDFYNQGYHVVVDLDLKSFFDTVDHDLLIKFVGQYIDDEWLLKLIRKFLTSGVIIGKKFQKTEKGTPQGGNLSPLLANIYLNELDKVLTSRGHKFVRYADDCNIYVKSRRAGERVLKSITKFLEKDLKLTMNREKTKVGSPRKLKFLGFSLGSYKVAYLRVSEQAKKKVKYELKTLTKRNRGRSLDTILLDVRQKMVGWLNYFSAAKMGSFIRYLNRWLRSRIRQYIWKLWKTRQARIRNLVKLGMPRHRARIFASTRKGYWRIAHSKTLFYTLTNRKLEEFGLINLSNYLEYIKHKNA